VGEGKEEGFPFVFWGEKEKKNRGERGGKGSGNGGKEREHLKREKETPRTSGSVSMRGSPMKGDRAADGKVERELTVTRRDEDASKKKRGFGEQNPLTHP